MLVQGPDRFLGVPSDGDLAVGVARGEQAAQLGLGRLPKPFVSHDQQPSYAVERIGLAAAMTEGLLLNATADLVELVAGQLRQVERIDNLGRVGQLLVEHLAVGAGHVQRRVADAGTPLGPSILQPTGRRSRITAFYEIEQPTLCHVNDRRCPPLRAVAATLDEQQLIEPERGRDPDACRVIHQPAAVGDDRVVDRVPVTAQVLGDLADRAAVEADLVGRPAARPVSQPQPCSRDRRCGLGPG